MRGWRIILPVCGLALFLAVTYNSVRMQGERGRSSRIFYWSSIRLDSDPLNRQPRQPAVCKAGEEDCGDWDIEYIWVSPGLLARLTIISALPAFLASAGIVTGLARLGISQVWSFMIATPLLVFAWFYLLGWIIDRRRLRKASAVLK